jgi:hypothetical protein
MQHKKFILFFASLCFTVCGFSQSAFITGTISDSKTGEPLPLATVFINSTTLSTAAQINGQYALRNIPEGPIEVVVRYIGYESNRIKIEVHTGDRLLLNIKLVPSTVELPNVQVKGKRDKEWEKQYRIFEKVFLGENSTGAKILNPGIIDFKESDKGKLLLASASEPIEIENPGLGYHIFYYLHKYQSNKETYSIIGDLRFEQLNDTDEKKITKWNKNRNEIYSGSLRHMVVSLVKGNAPAEGFQFYIDRPGSDSNMRSAVFSMNKNVIPLATEGIVFPGKKEGEFKIEFTSRVEVHYVNKIPKKQMYKDIPGVVGWIEPTHGVVEVNAQGSIVSGTTFVTSGYLSEARVADLLPANYRP